MSRAVKTDYKFDKETFAELLLKAKGDRTQTEFAQQCQISLAHLNRYLNENKENPPTPMTIRHIADVAQGGVSYDELMRTAGYNPEKYSETSSAKNYSPNLERLCMNEITYALRNCNFGWTALPPENIILTDGENVGGYSMMFDWRLQINNNKYFSDWFFQFKAFPSGDNLFLYLLRFYGQLSLIPFSQTTKVSLVVCDEGIFNQIKECPPRLFPIYLSVIFIDIDNETVQEEYLQTSLKLTDDLQDRYTLNSTNG